MLKSIIKQKLVIMSAALIAHSAAAQDGLTVGGFVDARYLYDKNDDSAAFALSDAALRVSHNTDRLALVFDLPLSFSNGAEGANLSLGLSKAQAYFDYKTEGTLFYRAGQFDGLYGYHSSDSDSWTSALPSRLWDLTPFTFTGVMVGFGDEDFTTKLVVANVPDQATAEPGDSPSAGVQLELKVGGITLAPGFLYQSPAANSSMLGELMAWGESGNWGWGFDFIWSKVEASDAGIAVMLDNNFSMSENLILNLRADYLKNGGNTFALAVGPSFTVTKNFRLRSDYEFSSSKADGEDESEANHRIAVSAVASF